MERLIFVDSGFLIALLDVTDDASIDASPLLDELYDDNRVTLVTTRAVLNEVLAHFSRGDGNTRRRIANFAKDTLDNPKYRVVPIDDDCYRAAIQLYDSRPDKRYSMVDCIGMTVMRQLGIEEVVATDRDFEQEGFINLMRPDRRRGIS